MKLIIFLLLTSLISCDKRDFHAIQSDYTYDIKRDRYELQIMEWKKGKIIASGLFWGLTKEQADSITNKQLKRCDCPLY